MTCRNEVFLESRDQVKSVLDAFREELDDHRESINENTNEIQASHEYFEALNNKLDNLSARLDELTLLVKGKKDDKNFNFSPLTRREKEVFQALLILCEMAPYATYREIARRLAITDSLVAQYVTNMIEKGIPILKKYHENKVFLRIDKDFKDLQLKKNVLKIDALLSNWVR